MFSQLPLYAVLAQVASASWLAQPEDSTWSPPRQTNEVEQAELSSNAVSPMPTSRPEDLAEMELFKRQTTLPDYTLAPDTCGFYVGFSTNSYTCVSSGQSCVAFSNTRFRGCCSGTQCSTFATTCIPSSSLTSGQSCGTGTTCCSASNNPACGTIYFSSLRESTKTQTIIQCWATTFDPTYKMQDIPPSLLSTKTSTTSKTTTTDKDTTTTGKTTTTPAVPGQTEASNNPSDANAGSNNVGAIVGGVVGGVAGIALIVGGVVFLLLRKKKNANSPQPGEGFPPATGAPPGGPMGPNGSPPPMMQGAYAAAPMMAHQQQDPTKPPGHQQFYDPRYSYMPVNNPAGYPPSTMNGSQSPQPSYAQSMHSPGAQTGYQPSMAQSTPPPPGYLGAGGHNGGYPMGPPGQHAVEMPAHNPIGSEGNRAEMWSEPVSTDPSVKR